MLFLNAMAGVNLKVMCTCCWLVGHKLDVFQFESTKQNMGVEKGQQEPSPLPAAKHSWKEKGCCSGNAQ